MKIEQAPKEFHPYKIVIEGKPDNDILEVILLCASNFIHQAKGDGECQIYDIPVGQVDAAISTLMHHVAANG